MKRILGCKQNLTEESESQWWNVINNIEKYVSHDEVETAAAVARQRIKIKAANKILFSPIYDWNHELLLAYMNYHNIELPFIYKWWQGFYQGTHCWASRIAKSIEDGYKQVYEIDSSIIIKAAEKIPSAKSFLEGLE